MPRASGASPCRITTSEALSRWTHTAGLARRLRVRRVCVPPRWVSLDECWSFWNREVRDHLCPDGPIDLDAFDGGYCDVASLWTLATGERVVVLERQH